MRRTQASTVVRCLGALACIASGAKGEHRLTFACRGRNPAWRGHFIGVDVFSVEEVSLYAVKATDEAE